MFRDTLQLLAVTSSIMYVAKLKQFPCFLSGILSDCCVHSVLWMLPKRKSIFVKD